MECTCIFPKLLRILKIVLRNHGYSDTKEIFCFEINFEELDTFYKIDLDLMDCFEKKTCLLGYN